MDVSVLIPARSEIFLAETVRSVLENIRADTEVIVVADGWEPEPPLPKDERVTVLRYAESIGQRAATNAAARHSEAKYLMKLDGHCMVAPGFDATLMADCQPDWTMIPAMHKLHAFDWECTACGNQTYQGSKPRECSECKGTEFRMQMVWKPKHGRPTVSWRFDSDLHFQYWKAHSKRPEAQGDLIETMSCNGPCMFLERNRYWALDGMDEGHGSWGQFGTEVACKAWLSGGKLITSKKTWFAHLFRTGNFRRYGESAFPYPISGEAQEYAKQYSRDFWRNDRWPKAIHPLSWLVDRFAPVPGWPDAGP